MGCEPTPTGGFIYFGQYDFHAPVMGEMQLGTGILVEPISPTQQQFHAAKYRWKKLASQCLKHSVRILVGRFDNLCHPLINELSKLVETHHITTGAGSEFPICVLGDVVRFKGIHRQVHTTAVARGLHMNFPAIRSITIHTPKKDVEKTVNDIISVKGL